MASMRLPDDVRRDIVAHARAEAPDECCGLLVGTGISINASVRARNIHPDRATRYLIDPAAHIAAARRLRGTDRAVIGCYHSHPTSPAAPSERDVAEACYPDFVWVIVSLLDPGAPDIAAYTITDGHVTRLALV